MNLGVDVYVREITPLRYRPGLGLRPGGERPEIEANVQLFYAALYDSIAAHSRLGLNVVVDVGHHDAHSKPQGVLADCARRLAGLPALLIGVRCPIEIIMARRNAGQAGRDGVYVTAAAGAPTPRPVLLWQEAVPKPGVYDFEVDTSLLSPEECAEAIRALLQRGVARPTAFERLAAGR